MSFTEGKDLAKTLISRYEAIRREAVKKLPQAKSVVFNVVTDIMYRVERALEYLSELEKVAGISGDCSRRLCGNLLLVRAGNITTAMKLKPVQALTYDGNNKVIAISNDVVKMVVAGTSIKLVFRGRTVEFDYADLDDTSSKAELIKAIARYVVDLADRLQYCIEQCAKLRNIRL